MKFCKMMLALISLAVGSAIAADGIVIIHSSSDEFKPGSIIPIARSIELGAQDHLTLITAEGSIIKLKGPHTGQIELPAKQVSQNVLRALSKVVKAAHSSDRTLATFRGSSGNRKRIRADLWGIDLTKDGNYCLLKDSKLSLWWPDAVKGARVIITEIDTNKSLSMTWKKAAKWQTLSDEFVMVENASYSASIDLIDKKTSFTVTFIPQELGSNIDRLTWMSDQKCDGQSIRLLAEIVGRSG